MLGLGVVRCGDPLCDFHETEVMSTLNPKPGFCSMPVARALDSGTARRDSPFRCLSEAGGV